METPPSEPHVVADATCPNRQTVGSLNTEYTVKMLKRPHFIQGAGCSGRLALWQIESRGTSSWTLNQHTLNCSRSGLQEISVAVRSKLGFQNRLGGTDLQLPAFNRRSNRDLLNPKGIHAI